MKTYQITDEVSIKYENFENLDKVEVEMARDLCPFAIKTLTENGFDEKNAIAFLVGCVHEAKKPLEKFIKINNIEMYKNFDDGFFKIRH